MADSFLIKSSKVPKGSSGSGGGSTIINNYTTVNNYTSQASEDADNFKGKITVDELNAIPEDDIRENDLYLVYAGYSEETGWSEDKFYLGPTSISYLSMSSGRKTVVPRSSRTGEAFKIVAVLNSRDGLEICPCDASGNQLPGQRPWFEGMATDLNIEITPDGDSDYFFVYTISFPLTLSIYDPVDPATFAVYGSVAYTDQYNKLNAHKCWVPTSRTVHLDAPSLYDPLQPKNDLITGLYPSTSFESGLYGKEIAGLRLLDLSCYTLGRDSVYHIDTFTQSGRYGGSTQIKTVVVPFARYFEDATGDRTYYPGCLTASDYKHLIEGGGSDVTIDTSWPADPADDHVPSTLLVKESMVDLTSNQNIEGKKFFLDTLGINDGIEIENASGACGTLYGSGLGKLNFSNPSTGSDNGIPLIGDTGNATTPVYIDSNYKTKACSPIPVIDSSWPASPSDTHAPSSKLVKDTMVDTSSDQTVSGTKFFSDGVAAFYQDGVSFRYTNGYTTSRLYTNSYGDLFHEKSGNSYPVVLCGSRGSETTPVYISESGFTRACNIPAPSDHTITLKQGGVVKGSFSLNQNLDSEILLDAGGSLIDIDTSWPEAPSDTHVPSTKLVKNSMVDLTSEQTITARKYFESQYFSPLAVSSLPGSYWSMPAVGFFSKKSDSEYSRAIGYIGVKIEEDNRTSPAFWPTPSAPVQYIARIYERGDASTPVYIDANGFTRACTGGSSVTIDTTWPVSLADDHVPSTKLVKTEFSNYYNSITCDVNYVSKFGGSFIDIASSNGNAFVIRDNMLANKTFIGWGGSADPLYKFNVDLSYRFGPVRPTWSDVAAGTEQTFAFLEDTKPYVFRLSFSGSATSWSFAITQVNNGAPLIDLDGLRSAVNWDNTEKEFSIDFSSCSFTSNECVYSVSLGTPNDISLQNRYRIASQWTVRDKVFYQVESKSRLNPSSPWSDWSADFDKANYHYITVFC